MKKSTNEVSYAAPRVSESTVPSESHLVLSVCETARGGVGRFQDSLQYITPYGFALHVLAPEEDRDLINCGNVSTFPRKRRGLRALYALIVTFMKARKKFQPDLYFFNSTLSLLPLLVLRMIGDRTPAVYCAHCWAVSNWDADSVKGRLIRAFEGQLCGLADLVIEVSHADAERAASLGYRGRHVVVENAVPDCAAAPDADPFERKDADAVELLFVGRFDRQKGLDVLLPAFARARATAPHLRLHLVGGPVRSASAPELSAGVIWHGWIAADRLDAYYSAADALVVPSRWEGLPLIVPEALRNGTPVLVSDKSGLPDLVETGETGLVFELEEMALAQRLARLRHPDLSKMRPAARASYDARFSMPRFSEEMAEHLRALVQGK